MKEKGIVLEVKDNTAVVAVLKKDGEACGHCSLCKKGQSGSFLLDIPEAGNVKKGETVDIEIDDKAALKGIFFVYGFPLIGFILAAVSAYSVQPFYLKTVVFLSIFLFTWWYGLRKGNEQGRKNKARII